MPSLSFWNTDTTGWSAAQGVVNKENGSRLIGLLRTRRNAEARNQAEDDPNVVHVAVLVEFLLAGLHRKLNRRHEVVLKPRSVVRGRATGGNQWPGAHLEEALVLVHVDTVVELGRNHLERDDRVHGLERVGLATAPFQPLQPFFRALACVWGCGPLRPAAQTAWCGSDLCRC